MKNFHFSRLIAGAIVALMLSVSMTSSLEARQRHGGPGNGAPFTGIVAFGDSLTDNGNIFELTGGCYPNPILGYDDGRFSNGLVWLEYLAQEMGIEPGSVRNFAVGGATSGYDNINDNYDDCLNDEYPGLQDELDSFEAELNGKKADKRALYVVWAGSNDFYDSDLTQADQTISTGVLNNVIAVQRLHQAGAKRIMVVKMPDLGLTPFGNGPATASLLTIISRVYNDTLDLALDGLAATGVETIRVDASGVLQDAVSNPEDFGFSNVDKAYLPYGQIRRADPSEFLFWDPFHPTTRGHLFLAEEAMRVLREEFPHVLGKKVAKKKGTKKKATKKKTAKKKANRKK